MSIDDFADEAQREERAERDRRELAESLVLRLRLDASLRAELAIQSVADVLARTDPALGAAILRASMGR